MARKFDLNDAHIYADPEKLLRQEKLDFFDTITEIDTHPPLYFLAAKHKIPIICQKPMVPDSAIAENIVNW